LKRIIGRYIGSKPGNRVVCIGGIHGNEPAGVAALENVLAYLQSDKIEMEGELIAITGNMAALKAKKRYINFDLNRLWHEEQMDYVRHALFEELKYEEEKEQKELLRLFDFLAVKDGILFVDLHTTSAEGGAFTFTSFNPIAKDIATKLPVPILQKETSVLSGTTLHLFNDLDCCGLAFEGGQHDNPGSVANIESAIWLILEATGNLTKDQIPKYEEHVNRLINVGKNLPPKLEITYCHAIMPEDEFEMLSGFQNFQPVEQGEVLAKDKNGEILSPSSGLLLMPLYQQLGEEGFYIIKSV